MGTETTTTEANNTALVKQVETIGGHFIAISDDTKLKKVIVDRIKKNSSLALKEVLSIIQNKNELNAELSDKLRGTPYEKVNHAYNLVNDIINQNDLEKSTEKTLTSIAKVLLVSGKVDFSLFVNDLKDFETYAKNSTFLEPADLLSNDTFKARIATISSLFNGYKEYNDGEMNKKKRGALGAQNVTLAGETLSLIAIFKTYKVNKDISLETFNVLSEAYHAGLKAYYEALNA